MHGDAVACLSRRRLARGLVACAALGIAAGPAAAATTSASPPAPVHAPSRELTAAPVSAAALAATIKQQTGDWPSQVVGQRACGAPTAGTLPCQAVVIVSAHTGRPVTPPLPSGSALPLLGTIGPLPVLSIGELGPSLGTYPRSPASERAPMPTAEPATPVPAARPIGTPPPAPGTPAFLRRAYDLAWLSTHRGSGDTVAIVDSFADDHAEHDLGVFRSKFGMAPCTTDNGCFRKVEATPGAPPPPDPTGGWEVETSLDLEAVSALCPQCHIVLVQTATNSLDDVEAAIRVAAVDGGASQISLSLSTLSTIRLPGQWAYPGVSTLAATGDSGYVGSDNVPFPAGDPTVSSIGGTDLVAAQNPRGVDESAWSQSGSGCAPGIPKPSFQAGTGTCPGRAVAGVSAVAWGASLDVYDSSGWRGASGWFVVGGTSLATPLVAAFMALTGVDSGNTPAWAYANEHLLNDIVSGSNESSASCAPEIAYICHAGPGFDGPTGVGSISGDVAPGAPGIGGTFTEARTGTTALVAGGVYPNSEQTAYRVQYGRTTSYGRQTGEFQIGSGASLVPVQAELRDLEPRTDYHFRLVATNGFGTQFGYDASFTTGAPPPPQITAVPTLAGATRVGSVVRLAGGRYQHGSVSRVGFYRCARSCTLLSSSATPRYRLTTPAVGYLVRARVTVSGGGHSVSAYTGYVGPVSSPSAGAVQIEVGRASGARVAVRGFGHRLLAQVTTRSVHGAEHLTASPGTRHISVRVFVQRDENIVHYASSTAGRPVSVTATRGERVAVSAVGG